MLSEWSLASESRVVAAAGLIAIYAGFCFFTALKQRRKAVDPASMRASTQVIYASQTGFAEAIATQTVASLRSAGQSVSLTSIGDVDVEQLAAVRLALFVVSTTGEGDAPDAAAGFVRNTVAVNTPLPGLQYAVLALGDRAYENFCAFGHRVDQWLRHQGAQPLFDMVEVDNGDEGSLRHWQHQVGVVTGMPDLPDWETARYERWRLVERRLVNPGSAGLPCFHLRLQPDRPDLTWTAGDIAEIDPRNSSWTSPASVLPHREYSIASIPKDGAVELLVRQMVRPDRTAGIGSGWLTTDAPIGGDVAMRIRTNTSFHPPSDSQPLLLIGNGTGIAGLRALLKSRIAAGHHRNWLLFGERNRAIDYFYGDDIERWYRDGYIEKLDLVFSRDQSERRYVQHRLLERAAEVRHWLSSGAVFVCGSLEGMAPAVDAALGEILGSETLETLLVTGRYRRDVY